jgi:hypothetical protein
VPTPHRQTLAFALFEIAPADDGPPRVAFKHFVPYKKDSMKALRFPRPVHSGDLIRALVRRIDR